MASGGPSGLSHVQILTSSDYTLRRCLDVHKVVPALLKQKSLPKRFRLTAKVAEKRGQLSILLGALKDLDLDGFALFLEALDSLQDEKHNEALSVLSTEMRFMSLPLEAQSTKVIEKIMEAHYHETVTKDEPEGVPSSQSTPVEEQPTPELHVAIAPLSLPSPPLPPPNLTLGNVESQTFTKAGGTFYSPTHGVKVHIPPKSLPPNAEPFELRMTASLRGPYKFPPDCELCTAIIHLKCEPPMGEFCDWVTVEIPHCVTEAEIEAGLDNLCIISARDELISGVYEFHEDPEMEVDFSDTYKVVFNTKHFSRSAGVRRQRKSRKRTQGLVHGEQKPKSQHQVILRERKQKSLDSHYKSKLEETSVKMRSMSLPSSATSHPDSPQGAASALLSNECHVGNEYYVAMCTPNDRSQPQWNTAFLVSYSLSSGLVEINEAARRILGTAFNVVTVPFVFADAGQSGRYVEFDPESWQSDGWKVESTKHPAMIAERDVVTYVQLPGDVKEALNFCPHSLLYDVDGRNMRDLLRLPIHVTNATCHNKDVSFLLTSTASPAASKSEQRKGSLHIISELYNDQSHFWQALSGKMTQEFPLKIDDNSVRKFLVEISLQLPSWQNLAEELQLDQSFIECLAANHQSSPWQFEAAYQMLRNWLAQKPLVATLANLLAALRAQGYIVNLCSWKIQFEIFQQIPYNIEARDEFQLFSCKLSERIGSQWKFVARQLGVAEHNIDAIARDLQDHGVIEQAYQMLLKWQTMNCSYATYGALMDAIHAVNEHASPIFNDACHFTMKHIRQLTSIH